MSRAAKNRPIKSTLTPQVHTRPVTKTTEELARGVGARVGGMAYATMARRLDEGDPLGAVEALPAAQAGLDVLARQAVQQARDAGASWADIGRVLGVTKQAAQQRYGPPATPWNVAP
jgi:hypothetical protein